MTHSNSDDALLGSIRDVIRDCLGSQHVVNVLVERDDEIDDESVLLVTVVIDASDADLNEDDVLGLVRHLQPALSEIGEAGFPIISFLTEQELKEAA